MDVLSGKRTAKVIQHEHQNLSTFGIGKELTQNQWRSIASQLVQKGLLSEGGKYGRHRLTAKAYETLKNKSPILGTLTGDSLAPAPGKLSGIEYDQGLFEILRKKRKELADAAQVPPYVIFSDRTLAEMAVYYPMTEPGMKGISGIGAVKFARYGKDFLELIRGYCQPRNLEEKSRQPARQTSQAKRPDISARSLQVGEAFSAGRPVADLSTEWGVSPDTILQHLVNYALDGHPLRQSDEFLKMSHLQPDQQIAVGQAFEKLGAQRLKPVFEALGGTISYDELKILRLHYLCSSQP